MSADLKKEVEKKRQRLEELRKRKGNQDRVVAAKESLKKSNEADGGLGKDKERAAVEDLVNDLIGAPSSQDKSSGQQLKPEVKKDDPKEGADVVQVVAKRKTKLILDHLAPVSIKPRETPLYDKHTQTDITVETTTGDNEDEENGFVEQTAVVAEVKVEEKKSEEPAVEEEIHTQKELTDEERDQIFHSSEFRGFIDRATRTVERALAEPSGLFINEWFGDGESLAGPSLGTTVTPKLSLSNDRWTKGRVVTHLDWSDIHPELLLSAYNRSEENTNDPDGLVLLWNTKLQDITPEYVLETQSPVLCASFAKFHPSYILGGTYSGQVVLWDTRSNRRTPVQRSPLSSSTHTHPVYCLRVVGTQNAHNLVTLSTSGRLCSWSVDMLSQPQETLDLQSKSARNVAATCMDFPNNEVNKLVVGSEECEAYLAQRHGGKSGVSLSFAGHKGTISGISLNKTHGQPDFSHLFLTSSFDWTVKLWSLKLQNEQQITSKTGRPLCSFSVYNDYVHDVQWSPKHPAVFATVDGSGKLAVWNLNLDFEEPVVMEQLDNTLSTLSYTSSGQYVATGDEAGKISIFELGEGLYMPQADDWTRLQARLLAIPEMANFEESLGSQAEGMS